MRYLFISILLISITLITGCTATGHFNPKTRTMTISGYGASKYTYEAEGVKASIERGEPIAFPDSIPIVK